MFVTVIYFCYVVAEDDQALLVFLPRASQILGLLVCTTKHRLLECLNKVLGLLRLSLEDKRTAKKSDPSLQCLFP